MTNSTPRGRESSLAILRSHAYLALTIDSVHVAVSLEICPEAEADVKNTRARIADPTALLELKLVEAASRRLMRGHLMNRPVLQSWSQLIDYCHACMAYSDREAFRVLFLDRKNLLIADEADLFGP